MKESFNDCEVTFTVSLVNCHLSLIVTPCSLTGVTGNQPTVCERCQLYLEQQKLHSTFTFLICAPNSMHVQRQWLFAEIVKSWSLETSWIVTICRSNVKPESLHDVQARSTTSWRWSQEKWTPSGSHMILTASCTTPETPSHGNGANVLSVYMFGKNIHNLLGLVFLSSKDG